MSNYLEDGYIKDSEIICLLVDKEENLFIGIINEGISELRINDKGPFGLPLANIENGDLFKFINWHKPGSMVTQILPCVISDYTKILSESRTMKSIDEHMKGVFEGYDFFVEFPKKIKNLRDSKIEKIIK